MVSAFLTYFILIFITLEDLVVLMFIKFNLILSPFPPDCSTPIIYFYAFSRSSSDTMEDILYLRSLFYFVSFKNIFLYLSEHLPNGLESHLKEIKIHHCIQY